MDTNYHQKVGTNEKNCNINQWVTIIFNIIQYTHTLQNKDYWSGAALGSTHCDWYSH